jgi:parallel beta-helix repeat protein
MRIMRVSRGLLGPVVLLAACAVPAAPPPAAAQLAGAAMQATPPARPGDALVITRDTVLDPTRRYGPIVIAASGITLDGRGAVVEGAVVADESRAAGAGAGAGAEAVDVSGSGGAAAGRARAFTGVGIEARGVHGVTLRGVTVRGFRIGVRVSDADDWTIEDCDASDNFHDPDFGWGEQEPGGGFVLTGVRRVTLRGNRANRNWDACSLLRCDDGTFERNDFSHASNTCLKLWNSSRNTVQDNDLSWGLRIAPGETHARDSTCVLIESGSDDNRFLRNDATHGGDGIFLRVLNGWTSRRNLFKGNDVSWANNNGFEAWSPDNTYVSNVANHCSYGFWLGASERTTLIDNEAGFNGRPDGFHNAPESFGHGGIVFVNGPSSHTSLLANDCHDNAGGGIVLRGDVATQGAAWKAFHALLVDNTLERNRWGVYLEHADWIDIGTNHFADNGEGEVHDAGGVTNLGHCPRTERQCFDLVPSLQAPARAVRAGERVLLSVGARYGGEEEPDLTARWDLRDGTRSTELSFEHAWERPGRYSVGVTVRNASASRVATTDILVVDDAPELGAEGAAAWCLADGAGASRAAFADDSDALVGAACVHAHIEPYDGGRVALLFPASRALGLPLAGRSVLRVWLRVLDPGIPSWQGGNPVLTLHASASRWRRLTPTRDWLGNPARIEGRDGWNLIEVPLSGDAVWQVEESGAARDEATLDTLNWLVLGVDSWGTPPLDVRVDGLVIR